MKGTIIANKQRKLIAVIPIIVTPIILLSIALTSNNSLFAFAQEQTSTQGVKTLRIGTTQKTYTSGICISRIINQTRIHR